MIDYHATARAIVEGRLTDAWTGSCRLVASDAASHPVSVVEWQVSNGISKVVLDANFRNSPRLSFFAGRLAPTLSLLEAAHATGELPDRFTMRINLNDGPATRGIAFCSNNPLDLLVPDPVFIVRNAYAPVRVAFTDPVPWRRRLPVVFWRGGSSGFLRTGQDWRELPRIRLCELARIEPVLDAGLSHVAQLSDEAQREIKSAGLLRARIPEYLFNQYRYHIDIDGNTNSWPGLFIKLLSGSPVLKIASPHGFRQWYYDRLVPDIHYVQVASDMSDLLEKAHWLMADDKRAIQIGEQARALALSMTREAEVTYAGHRIAHCGEERA